MCIHVTCVCRYMWTVTRNIHMHTHTHTRVPTVITACAFVAAAAREVGGGMRRPVVTIDSFSSSTLASCVCMCVC
jgi:hypothetical protein